MSKLLVALFYQIPEGIFLSIAGLGLLGIKKPKKNIILAGILYGIVVAVLRNIFEVINVPPWFFFHTIMLLPVYILISKAVLKVSATTPAAAWMFSVLIIMLGEQTVLSPLRTVFQLDFVEIMANPWIHILWGWIGITPLILMAVIVSCTDFVLIQAPRIDKASSKLSR